MKILGIDTTTKVFSIGLTDGKNIYEYNLELGTKQSVLLAPTLKRIVLALGWKFEEIDYFACGLGPGSFTGIRVGLSTIKGLSWALKKPVIGFSSLDLLALNATEKEKYKYIAPTVDAKRNLVYTCLYNKKSGNLNRLSDYKLISKEKFFKTLKDQTIILGDAINLFKAEIKALQKKILILDEDYWKLSGSKIIDLTLKQISKKKINNTFDIKPIYLYPDDCQIKK